jgi:hypothetical protein
MMRLGAKIFGGLSGILLLFLLVGLLLPGSWQAREEILLPATPSSVFPLVNRLSAWKLWTPFPESGLVPFGPPEGVGAGLRWDDPQYGKGEVRIIGSRKDVEVSYQVVVDSGALTIRGALTLEAEGGGTRLRWVEEGDFGWNPLMGYAARGMAASQGEAMKASLGRLTDLLAGSGGDSEGPRNPGDSVSAPAAGPVQGGPLTAP